METTPPQALPFDLDAEAAIVPGAHLQRLQRLVGLRQRHERELNRQGLRLLDRAIFAAFCDCRDAGAEAQARATLRQAKFAFDQQPAQSSELDAALLPWREAQSAS